MERAVEHSLFAVGHEVAVGVDRERMVNGLAIDCERGGVEDLDGAVLDAFFDLGQLSAVPGARWPRSAES